MGESHKQIRALFDKLSAALLTVNPVKREFSEAQVAFLGHVVGQVIAKDILNLSEQRLKPL